MQRNASLSCLVGWPYLVTIPGCPAIAGKVGSVFLYILMFESPFLQWVPFDYRLYPVGKCTLHSTGIEQRSGFDKPGGRGGFVVPADLEACEKSAIIDTGRY